MKWTTRFWPGFFVLPILAGGTAIRRDGFANGRRVRQPEQELTLTSCRAPNVPVPLRCGTFEVFENRAAGQGTRIPLYVRVLPAGPDSATASDHTPLVFVSAGGPGLTNSDIVPYPYARGWWRDRDVVMVDLRGTSGPDRLDCETPGSADHPAGYLESAFDLLVVRRCREQLERRADLRQYTTHNVVEDLRDVITALRLGHVNLWGASGGTREVLEFIRHYPSMVRSAIVEGVAPVAFKNPLPHAAAAQEALDSLFVQCARDADCSAAYPRLGEEFSALRDRLLSHAVDVRLPTGLGGRDTIVRLTWSMVAEVVRTMSYTPVNERSIPFLVHRAAQDDFGPIIVAGIQANRGNRDAIRYGFLLSQTCSEDVPRITQPEIAAETRGTYMGDSRVREQQAACKQWARAPVAAAELEPVRSEVPVLLISGTIDPVTRPTFAAAAARYLSHSIHIVAPGGHGGSGPCIEKIERQFLDNPMLQRLDTTCVSRMALPPFRLQ